MRARGVKNRGLLLFVKKHLLHTAVCFIIVTTDEKIKVVLMNKKINAAIIIFTLLSLLTGCGKEATASSSSVPSKTPEEQILANAEITDDMIKLVQFAEGTTATEEVTVSTSIGDITVVLYPEYAPKAVENFLALAKTGYYDGQKFYRLVNNYMAQAGDPTGMGTGGESSFKDEGGKPIGFPCEYSINLWNFKGAIGMFPSAEGLNDSRFYIVTNSKLDAETISSMTAANFPKSVQAKYEAHGGAPWLDGKYTVFGQVTEGFDILDELSIAKTNADKLPLTDIIIKKISVKAK